MSDNITVQLFTKIIGIHSSTILQLSVVKLNIFVTLASKVEFSITRNVVKWKMTLFSFPK